MLLKKFGNENDPPKWPQEFVVFALGPLAYTPTLEATPMLAKSCLVELTQNIVEIRSSLFTILDLDYIQ